MDECKGHAQRICYSRRALRSSGVGANHDGLLVLWDVVLDVFADQVAAVQVVHGDVEEALVLRVVQVHGDDVIGAGAGEQVGNESAGLGNPLLVARLGLERRRVRGLHDTVDTVDAVGGSRSGRGRAAVSDAIGLRGPV